MAINQDKAKVPRRLPRQGKGSEPATETRQRFRAGYWDKTKVPSRLPRQDKGSMAINQYKAKVPRCLQRQGKGSMVRRSFTYSSPIMQTVKLLHGLIWPQRLTGRYVSNIRLFAATVALSQFSSRWYLYHQKSLYALHSVSQTFPQSCPLNGSSVRLIDNDPLSPFQGRSSSTSFFYASLLQAILRAMSLALACVVWLSPLDAIQRRACVTASTSSVKLEVEF